MTIQNTLVTILFLRGVRVLRVVVQNRRGLTACCLLLFGWTLALAQNYVFGPNVRVNSDSPGTCFRATYSAGQHLIAARADTVYLVWRDDRGGDSHIYFARSNDAGCSFLREVRVDNNPGCVGIMPSLAVDDSGGIHVCWLNYNVSDGAYVHYAKSTNGGASFLPSVRACDSARRHQYAVSSIAVSRNGRRIYVARDQSDIPGGPIRIYVSRSTDGGATFVAPETRIAADSAEWFQAPSVAVFQDSIVVITCDSVTSPNLYPGPLHSRSVDGGVTFGAFESLSDSSGSRTSLGVDSAGRFYAAWGGGWLAVSNDTGRTFSAPWRVWGGADMSLWASRSGQLYTAWWYHRSPDDEVRFACSTDGGRIWPRPVNPSDAPAEAWEGDATVAASEDGKVFIAWSDSRHGLGGWDYDIYVATGVMSAITEQPDRRPSSLALDLPPSPTRCPVRVDYSLSRASPLRVAVLDRTGRQVLILHDGPAFAGRSQLSWGGLNARGNAVPAGVYFFVLTTPDEQIARRVTLIRE